MKSEPITFTKEGWLLSAHRVIYGSIKRTPVTLAKCEWLWCDYRKINKQDIFTKADWLAAFDELFPTCDPVEREEFWNQANRPGSNGLARTTS
jgi:Cft2 family RNA processing exonuclease